MASVMAVFDPDAPFRRQSEDAGAVVVPVGGVDPSARADPARLRDEALPDIDWRAYPDGTERSAFPGTAGPLARIGYGPADGPRVLLVPGVTGSKEDFLLMLPLLAEAGYRADSFDLAGQFESAAAGPEQLDPPREHYDERLLLDDFNAILSAGRTPVHVLGYSFASTLTQLSLRDRPELFASLTLLSPPPRVGQAFRAMKRVGPLSDYTSPQRAAAVMIWGIRNNLTKVPPRRLAFVRGRLELTRRDSVDDIMALMMATPDLRAEVRAAPVPKLVAVGLHDLWPVEIHKRYADDIGAAFAAYATGHSPCETAPHQLVRDMLALFERSGVTPG